MGITTITIFSIVIFIAYICGVVLIRNKRVIPDSLLKTVFRLPECCRYVWATIVVIICYCMIPVFLATQASLWCSALIIAGCCGLIAGATSLIVRGTEWSTWVFYKNSTMLFCACSQLLIGTLMPVLLAGWLLYTPCIINKNIRHQRMFWLQIFCFVMNFVLCLLIV